MTRDSRRGATLVLSSWLLLLAAAAQSFASLALDPRWSVALDGPYAAPPGYDSSSAYVPLKTGTLLAVDLDRGQIRWRRQLSTTLTPETGDGRVYVVSSRRIHALIAGSGDVAWQTPLTGEVAAPLYWDTGWLLTSLRDGDLLALRATDGSIIWRRPLGSAVVARPAPALDRLYVPLRNGRLVALKLATGETVWERTLSGTMTGLTSLDDQLIVGTTQDEVHSLDLVRGTLRWRWRVGGDVTGPAAFDDRYIYFASRENVLRAVDRRSGNLRWMTDLPSRPIAGPIRHPEGVLIPLAGGVMAFNPVDGKAIATIASSGEIGAAPFARVDARPTAARLMAISRDGQLQGFGVRFEPRPAPLETLPGQTVVP